MTHGPRETAAAQRRVGCRLLSCRFWRPALPGGATLREVCDQPRFRAWSPALTCPIPLRLRSLYKIPLTHDGATRDAPVRGVGANRAPQLVATRGAAGPEKQILVTPTLTSSPMA